MTLYDLVLDLTSADGGLPRDSFKDWMRVRVSGANMAERKLSLPPVVGSIFFHNVSNFDVVLRRGGAVPVRIGRNEIVHVMLDGTASGMWKVG